MTTLDITSDVDPWLPEALQILEQALRFGFPGHRSGREQSLRHRHKKAQHERRCPIDQLGLNRADRFAVGSDALGHREQTSEPKDLLTATSISITDQTISARHFGIDRLVNLGQPLVSLVCKLNQRERRFLIRIFADLHRRFI